MGTITLHEGTKLPSVLSLRHCIEQLLGTPSTSKRSKDGRGSSAGCKGRMREGEREEEQSNYSSHCCTPQARVGLVRKSPQAEQELCLVRSLQWAFITSRASSSSTSHRVCRGARQSPVPCRTSYGRAAGQRGRAHVELAGTGLLAWGQWEMAARPSIGACRRCRRHGAIRAADGAERSRGSRWRRRRGGAEVAL
jgi:hypothetical protein